VAARPNVPSSAIAAMVLRWRSSTSRGCVAHVPADGRPHVTPVCFVLDGDELAFALSPGSVKGKSLARDRRIAVCVSDERQPYGFVTVEGHARISAEPDEVTRVAAGIAARYYPSSPRRTLAGSFVEAGFTAVRIGITTVIARSGSAEPSRPGLAPSRPHLPGPPVEILEVPAADYAAVLDLVELVDRDRTRLACRGDAEELSAVGAGQLASHGHPAGRGDDIVQDDPGVREARVELLDVRREALRSGG
jgi:PPOX class probable F420-dependent enzyme